MTATPRPRALVTVAHPDDQSFGCGSLLAWLRAHDVETAVWCATRGEAGHSDVPRSPEDLGAVRERELHAAAAILDVSHVVVGPWRDSGTLGTPAAGTFAAAADSEVRTEIVRVIEELQPTLVFTLDASDGHRDHAVVRNATVAAAITVSTPPAAVYLSCLPRELMGQWVEVLRKRLPAGEHREFASIAQWGTPDVDITMTLDTADFYEARWQAIRAHASQTSLYEPMPVDLQRRFLTRECLQQVLPVARDRIVDRCPLDYLPVPAL